MNSRSSASGIDSGPLDVRDQALIEAVQNGLPLTSHPYADIGARIGMTGQQVMQRLQALIDAGVIKRLGVIVRHHELGYRANAMVVWDIADERVDTLGPCMSQFEFVTLCYRRPRRLPDWPYNLFCMIHGRDHETVLANVTLLAERCGLQEAAREVLFSRRRFKQRGAVYRIAHCAGRMAPETSLHNGAGG